MLPNYAQVKDSCKMQHRPMDFNITEYEVSQSLPKGSFHKPLILIHQRADRLKTIVTEN